MIGSSTWKKGVVAVRRRLGLPTSVAGNAPSPEAPGLDTELEPAMLRVLLTHVENCWRQLGETEPHWSVLAQPQFKSHQIVENGGSFYASGEHDARLFTEAANRSRVTLPLRGTCFELGCGVGRVTMWLARSFDHVIAADISSSHLSVAEQALREGGHRNVEFRLVNRLDAFDQLPRFDSFFTVIVLQHNPPPVMRWLLQTILSKLNPGGIGFFQLPTSLPHYSFNARAYLAQLPADGRMEMHALSYQSVLNVLYETGCELLEAQNHDSFGIPNSVFRNFLVRKSTAK